MAFWDKLFQNKKVKSTISGGFDLLKRLVTPELNKTGMLEYYGKSLYVFACVSKISEKVASVDWTMFRILNSAGDVKEIKTHPALDLLYKLNPFQTKAEFLETTMINLECTGDAFWWKIRNKSGKVVELWNLRPDFMTIVSDPTNFIKEYQFTRTDGVQVAFAPEDIIHFKYSDPMNEYFGMSPIKAGAVRVQTEDYATKYQRDFFLNSSRPDAIIKNPEVSLTPEQKQDIKDSWTKNYQGVGRSSKVAILEGGLEYQIISLSQKDMDYIEGLRFTRDDMLVLFKVPKSILAITDDVNRSNSETGMYIFLSETIVPKLKRLMDKINEEMIIPDFGDEFYVEFVDPTPANRDMELKEYESGLTNNYLLINEVRQKEGLPPIKGGWSIYMPIMNQAVGGLPAAEQGKAIKSFMKEIKETDDRIDFKEEPKRFDFKGKFWLWQKFTIRETVEKALISALKKVKKNGKKKIARSMINGDEVKKAYAELQIKEIDTKTGKLKTDMTSFAIKQKDRVMASLKKEGKKSLKEKVLSIDKIFDKEKEEGLTLDFIIPYIESYLKESGMEALNMIAPQETFNETKRIRDIIKKRARMFAESVNNTTLEKLDGTLSEGIAAGEGIDALADRVESVYEEFPSYRSELIARTEATASNNEGLLEGYKQSDVATGKEWIAVMDDRTREEHAALNGEIVALDQSFSNGLQYPNEPNCRCVLGPAFIE